MRAVVGIQEDTTIFQADLNREDEEALKKNMKFTVTERGVTHRVRSSLQLSAAQMMLDEQHK